MVGAQELWTKASELLRSQVSDGVWQSTFAQVSPLELTDDTFTPDAGVVSAAGPIDHLRTFDLFDRALAASPSEAGYRPEASLVVVREQLAGDRDDSRIVFGIDIVTNTRRVLQTGSATPDPVAAEGSPLPPRSVESLFRQMSCATGDG